MFTESEMLLTGEKHLNRTTARNKVKYLKFECTKEENLECFQSISYADDWHCPVINFKFITEQCNFCDANALASK